DMPQAAAPPRPRVICKRSELSRGGTASMPVREKGRRSPGSQPARPFSRPQPPANRRQCAGLFAYRLRVHCGDRLAAGGKWIRTCMGLLLSRGCFWFAESSLFGAGRPFFVPSPAVRFPERAEGVKGPKRLAACRLAALVFRSALTPEHAEGR